MVRGTSNSKILRFYCITLRKTNQNVWKQHTGNKRHHSRVLQANLDYLRFFNVHVDLSSWGFLPLRLAQMYHIYLHKTCPQVRPTPPTSGVKILEKVSPNITCVLLNFYQPLLDCTSYCHASNGNAIIDTISCWIVIPWHWCRDPACFNDIGCAEVRRFLHCASGALKGHRCKKSARGFWTCGVRFCTRPSSRALRWQES